MSCAPYKNGAFGEKKHIAIEHGQNMTSDSPRKFHGYCPEFRKRLPEGNWIKLEF